jgi:SAM-dependent methyltransferase
MKPYADHFSALAAEYASCRPGYPSDLFTYLAGVAPRRELAWDCAAGSGQATLPLTQWFRRVIGTDASAAMLAQASPHPKVEYRVAPAQQSGLDDRSVDLVTVAQALHWLELDAFYAEVERVLVPGGVLAVWTYGITHIDHQGADHILSHFYSQIVGPFWPADRRHVESGYRTLPFPFPELVPPAFVMQERWTLGQLLGYVGTWSATRRFREATGRDPVEDLAGELGRQWEDSATRRTISWPLSLRVGMSAGNRGDEI